MKLTKEAVSWIPETEKVYCLSITGADLFSLIDAVNHGRNPELAERMKTKVRTIHALSAVSSRRKGRGEP